MVNMEGRKGQRKERVLFGHPERCERNIPWPKGRDEKTKDARVLVHSCLPFSASGIILAISRNHTTGLSVFLSLSPKLVKIARQV